MFIVKVVLIFLYSCFSFSYAWQMFFPNSCIENIVLIPNKDYVVVQGAVDDFCDFIKIINSKTGEEIFQSTSFEYTTRCLAHTEGELNHFLTKDSQGIITELDLQGKHIKSINTRGFPAVDRFAPILSKVVNTKNFIITAKDRTTILDKQHDLLIFNSDNKAVSLKAHTENITSLISIPQTSIVVSASEDKTIKVWDLKKNMLVKTLYGHTDPIYLIKYITCCSRPFLVSGGLEGTLKFWDLNSGLCLSTLKTSAILDIMVDDKCMLKILDKAGYLKTCNIATGEWLNEVKVADQTIKEARFINANAMIIATDRKIERIDVK